MGKYSKILPGAKNRCEKITPTHFPALLGEEEGEERIPGKCLVFGGEA